jgi:hypothetical protein
MADPARKLIQEIAAKHGIAVSREDPIFVLHTINQRLLQDGAKAQQAMLDQYKDALGMIAQAWGNDAKAKAERSEAGQCEGARVGSSGYAAPRRSGSSRPSESRQRYLARDFVERNAD